MPRCARRRRRRRALPGADPRARAGRQSCRWTGRPPRFASSCLARRVSSRTACRSDCRSRSRSRCWRCSRWRGAARGPSWPRCCGIRWMTRPRGATCGASCIACAKPGCTTCSPPATTRSRWPAAFTAMRRSFASALAGGDLETAAQLHRAPLLDGFDLGESEVFNDWLAQSRDRLARQWQQAADVQAARLETTGDMRASLGLRERRIARDPLQESQVVHAMRLHATLGESMRHTRRWPAGCRWSRSNCKPRWPRPARRRATPRRRRRCASASSRATVR